MSNSAWWAVKSFTSYVAVRSADHTSYIFETMPFLPTFCRHSLFFCCPLQVCLLSDAESSLTAAFQRLICVAHARLVNRTPSLVSCSVQLQAHALYTETEQLWLLRCTSFRLFTAPHFRLGGTTETKLTACVKGFGIFDLLLVISIQVLANSLKVHPSAPHLHSFFAA